MAENASTGATEPVKKRVEKPKGVGAQAGSNRREYRKFRPRPTKKVTDDNAGTDSLTEAAAGSGKKARFCRFFNTAKRCRLGDECPFRHVKKVTAAVVPPQECDTVSEQLEPTGSAGEGTTITIDTPVLPVIVVPNNVQIRTSIPVKLTLTRADIGTEAQENALKAEILYFKRRYRHCTIESAEGINHIDFRYEVTEPDWVFDIRQLLMCLQLAAAHPLEVPTVAVRAQPNMPDILRQHLEKEMNDAIKAKYVLFEKRDKYELIGKLLMRWIDHNVLDLFVGGLKKVKLIWEAEAAGISLVVPALSSGSNVQDSVEEDEENRDESMEDGLECSGAPDSSNDLNVDAIEDVVTQQTEAMTIRPVESDKPPIDVVLVWNDLSQNIASIAPILLHISSTCVRCKCDHSHDVPANDRPVIWRCTKCSTAQSLRLRADLVHENSSVLAHLDARGCRPVDCVLLNSQLRMACLACNKEEDVQKINFGQPHKSWCRHCHTACEFVISVIRFRGDFSRISNEDKEAASKLPKPKKKIENNAPITAGQPLPETGTCKHYRKSYRWFRFPCCGRVFPCDTCHENASMDHEMKQANRMICGHCSFEQPFQKSKPCASCSEAITRSKSHFWEGGKGCRDQKHMNKNDGHKFAGGRKKTVAKSKAGDLLTKH